MHCTIHIEAQQIFVEADWDKKFLESWRDKVLRMQNEECGVQSIQKLLTRVTKRSKQRDTAPGLCAA
jgi:hypothetical protein